MLEDPELKILNVNTVVVSGGRERLFWRPLLGTWNPSMGALWTKSIRWWRSCDGSVTLSHCLPLYLSSARDVPDCLEYGNRTLDYLDEITDLDISIKLDWFMHRELFRCVSEPLVLIIYFQEFKTTNRRAMKYPLGRLRETERRKRGAHIIEMAMT